METHWSPSPRIAFVDLTFNWPPVGGCWIDAYHVMAGLQDHGAEVCLFTPDFASYYPRGVIGEALPFPYVKIPFNRFTFNFKTVIQRFRKAVNRFHPDLIFLMDGYFMKNHLLTAFGPERCFLRFYSYELLCINLHYYRYRENRICDQGYMQNPLECHRCWFRRVPAAVRGLQIAVGQKDRHPVLHFSQEYLASGAFSESYRQKLLGNLSRLRGAIVYNEFMRDRLKPYINEISMIPSGVDIQAFSPNSFPVGDGQNETNRSVKIFLPGRANDALKGLPILLQAGEILDREGLSFEIHYTAALDCPTAKPWLVNRQWVNQEILPQLYREMDIVVVPSIWIEPFGITALEGMSSGLPVVASRIGGLAQTTIHDVTGLLVEPNDPQALADALRRLIQNPDLRRSMGQAGRIRAMEQYDWNRIVDRDYVPMIDKALSHSSKSPNLEETRNSINEE